MQVGGRVGKNCNCEVTLRWVLAKPLTRRTYGPFSSFVLRFVHRTDLGGGGSRWDGMGMARGELFACARGRLLNMYVYSSALSRLKKKKKTKLASFQ